MLIGAAGLTFTNGTNSIMQLSTEPAMRGRVMALRIAIALGGRPDDNAKMVCSRGCIAYCPGAR